MEQFSELAKKRRSHRKFTDEKLTEEQMQTLINTALMSPTGKSLRSCSFFVVESPELIQRLSQSKASGSQFASEAQCCIVVVGDPSISDVWIEDGSAAAMSILYQVEDLGLGACWVQIRQRQTIEGCNSEDVVREILSLPESKRVLCFLAIGYKGMERKEQNMEKIETLKQELVVRLTNNVER